MTSGPRALAVAQWHLAPEDRSWGQFEQRTSSVWFLPFSLMFKHFEGQEKLISNEMCELPPVPAAIFHPQSNGTTDQGSELLSGG